MSLLSFALAAMLASAPNAAALANIGISGKTKAPDLATAKSALQEAKGFTSGQLKCSDVGDAAASLMPKGWAPADPNFRLGPKGARYERWEIKACGRNEPFLVVFWKTKGRPDFQVAHPFPTDPVKKP